MLIPILVTTAIIASLIIFYERKKLQKEIERIQSLDIERKKIEIMKLQVKMEKYKTSHVLHLLLTIFMLGFWIIPWLLISQSNRSKRNEVEKLINSI
jgi:preprotein translocase subunit YajC